MKTQKTFLIVITVLVAVGVTLQLITMAKNRKKGGDTPEIRDHHIELGELTQEVIED